MQGRHSLRHRDGSVTSQPTSRCTAMAVTSRRGRPGGRWWLQEPQARPWTLDLSRAGAPFDWLPELIFCQIQGPANFEGNHHLRLQPRQQRASCEYDSKYLRLALALALALTLLLPSTLPGQDVLRTSSSVSRFDYLDLSGKSDPPSPFPSASRHKFLPRGSSTAIAPFSCLLESSPDSTIDH